MSKFVFVSPAFTGATFRLKDAKNQDQPPRLHIMLLTSETDLRASLDCMFS